VLIFFTALLNWGGAIARPLRAAIAFFELFFGAAD
jgi:hypothetical protein